MVVSKLLFINILFLLDFQRDNYIFCTVDLYDGTYISLYVSNNNIWSVMFASDSGFGGKIPPLFLRLISINAFHNSDFLR